MNLEFDLYINYIVIRGLSVLIFIKKFNIKLKNILEQKVIDNYEKKHF
jgi:hypothetical protein